MYFISSNSGYLMYSTNVNYFFISETLKLPTSDYSDFIALQGFAWSIKPLYGWISDSFYPFRYRIKPYIFLTCVLYGLLCAFIALKEPSYSTFCNIWFLMNVCNAFIDAMAEGITAINTKLGSKIAKLQEAERRQTGVIEDEEEENEMKSFGLFNIIRGILRAFMAIVGGLMADKVSIHVSYLILGVYPVIMVLYTLFIFKEEKVRSILVSLFNLNLEKNMVQQSRKNLERSQVPRSTFAQTIHFDAFHISITYLRIPTKLCFYDSVYVHQEVGCFHFCSFSH